MIDGIAAANWLLDYGTVRPSMCLFYVWQAYKAQGASTDHPAVPRATDAWEASDGKHPGDRNPPAGAAVWWGRRYRDGNMDGDVVISLGGGRVAVTEAPGRGSVTGACTLDERENQIRREYLGWTSSIFDCPIAVSGGKAPAPTLTPTPLEEDDMKAIRIAIGTGQHLAVIGKELLRHFIGTDPHEWIKDVLMADDTWVEVSAADLPALLATYGVDLDAYRVVDGAFEVLDPLSGVYRGGATWTRGKGIQAALGKALPRT